MPLATVPPCSVLISSKASNQSDSENLVSENRVIRQQTMAQRARYCFQHAENFSARDAVECCSVFLSTGNNSGVL